MAKTNDSQEEKRKKREEWSLPFALPALRSNHGLVGRTGRSLIPLGTPNLQWVAQLNAGDAACSNGGRTGRYSKPNISAALRLQCTRAETPARFKDTSQTVKTHQKGIYKPELAASLGASKWKCMAQTKKTARRRFFRTIQFLFFT